jgi:hypothetical protein
MAPPVKPIMQITLQTCIWEPPSPGPEYQTGNSLLLFRFDVGFVFLFRPKPRQYLQVGLTLPVINDDATIMIVVGLRNP